MLRTRNKIVIVSIVSLLLFVFGFMFMSCGEQPKSPEVEKTPTDDGTLDYQANCETTMNYTLEDFFNDIGGRENHSFSDYDGFRFTYITKTVDNGDDIQKFLNGIITNQGVNFELQTLINGQEELNVNISIKDGVIYTRTNEHIDGDIVTTRTYKNFEDSSVENYIKSKIEEIKIKKEFFYPQTIIDEISSDAYITRYKQIFNASYTKDEQLFLIYLNLNDEQKLSAIKYLNEDLTEQVVLSGFNGTIEFPDFSVYVLEQ